VARARLRRRRVIADARPGVVRLSPYLYNTAADNEAVVEALRGVVGAGAPAS
jgi:selenocysteine lyase/cysteine desulfurase